MTTTEAYNTLMALSRADKPYSSAEEYQIAKLYTEVTGRTVRDCNCKDKWSDAIYEALHYIKTNGKMKEKCNYRLLRGVVIHVSGSSVVYTNDNLTDEVARKFLAENPNAVGRFEYIPAEQPKPKSKQKRKAK